MAYIKPELVELVHAAPAIQGGNPSDTDGISPDKAHSVLEFGETGTATSSAGAYQADE